MPSSTLTNNSKTPSDSDNLLGEVPLELQRHLRCTLGHDDDGSKFDKDYFYRAAAAVMRDRLSAPWRKTRRQLAETKDRRVHYLSLEFLLGRSLNNAALNLDLEQPLRDGLKQLGVSLEDAIEEECDAGLGNGGLGRLAV
ncbi:MAG: glycogen phosphorylase, partial [Mariniblastus sp.]